MFRGSKEPGEQGPPGIARLNRGGRARSVISYVAVREMGYSGVDVGRLLNLSGSGVTKSVEKGKRIISADESRRRKLIS
jgi:hypothetical protein